jgi:anaerobic selenocysteine-containing dehydrogenase
MSFAHVDPSVSKAPIALDAEGLSTVCVLCSHNCGLAVDVADGKIAKVRADERNPITKGYVCNKGFSVAKYAHHEQRTQHPLRRRPDGGFERIDWDTAIAEIAAKLSAIRAAHSPRAVALAGVGGQANHMDGN